jgi:hypothetical protein
MTVPRGANTEIRTVITIGITRTEAIGMMGTPDMDMVGSLRTAWASRFSLVSTSVMTITMDAGIIAGTTGTTRATGSRNNGRSE